MSKERLWELIEQRKKEFEDISDAVWDFAELRFQEHKSSKLQREFMEKEGFRITCPVAGMGTAFIAETGSGKPVFAILGENDALPQQSQVANICEQRPIEEGASGHACGHNLLGTGGMEAACALKTYMEENHIPGTLRYYACPGEEGGGGKVFMARAGVFDDVDIAQSWHPSCDTTMDNTMLACVSFYIRFHGVAAHAAGEPWNGRSALDAAELMNSGVNYLREHMLPTSRIHYAYTNAGGTAPNVVQPFCELSYCVRATDGDYMEELYNRVIDCAKGAALMTGCTLEEPYIYSAFKDYLWNDTLDELTLKNLEILLPQISYTEDELAYAEKLKKCGTVPDAETPIDLTINYDRRKPPRGSSDVADASYCMPLTQARVVSATIGSVGHGWTTTVVGKNGIAHKGMHTAAKCIASCFYDMWEDPSIIEKAKADHQKMLHGRTYKTMVPPERKPGDGFQ